MSALAYVGKAISPGSAPVGYTVVTAGNDIVIAILGLGTTGTLTSLTDSVGGETVIADFPYSSGCGVYRVHGAGAGAHTFTPVWATAPQYYWLVAVEVSGGIYGVDTALTPAVVTGSSVSPSTNSFSPPAAGDFLLGAFSVNHYLSSLGSWTNGFTQLYAGVGGPSYGFGYLANAPGGAPINAGVTINPAIGWAAFLMAYSGTAPPPIVEAALPRKFFLPPGPGRLGGRGGLAIGPFTTFLVKDVHRLVPRTATPVMPPAVGSAKNQGASSLSTFIRQAAAGRSANSGASVLSTRSPFSSIGVAVSAARATVAAPTHFASASQDVSKGVSSLATEIRLVSHAGARSSASGLPTTRPAFVSASHAKNAGRSPLATGIAISSRSRAAQLTKALATTSIKVHAAGRSVSRASAIQLKRVLFTSTGLSVSSGVSSLLTAKPISSVSKSTQSAVGELIESAALSSYSSSSSSGGAYMTTAIMLEMDPAAGSVNTGSIFQYVPVRFGYSIIEVEAQLALPPPPEDPVAILAGSACFVSAQWFDSDGNPYVPLAVNYSIQDVTSGEQIAGSASLPASDKNLVTVSSAQNAMINSTREAELHQVLFEITDQLGEIFYRYGAYQIVRAPGTD